MNPFYVHKSFITEQFITKRYNYDDDTLREMVEYNRLHHEIHEKVKRIPRFSLFFSPIMKWEKLNLTDSHVIIHRKKLTPFMLFFKDLFPQERTHLLISSFRHLLYAVSLLSDHGIDYIHYDDIGFQRNKVPVIYDFRNHVNQRYLPLEFHLYQYMKTHDVSALSYYNIATVIECFFNMHNETLTNEELKKCCNEFKNLINTSQDDIHEYLCAINKKCYVYGLGCLYNDLILHVDFPYIPENLIVLLSKCKTYTPSQRPTLKEIFDSLSIF